MNSSIMANTLNVEQIRKEFPILKTEANSYPLVYLDNAATSQKPKVVINAVSNYYKEYNSNVHRAAHFLSDKATVAYENARVTIKEFINAEDAREINFVRGTTEGINLVAYSFGAAFVKPGDEIIISNIEHHSNIVPWQMLCERCDAVLKVIPVSENGEMDLSAFEQLLSDKTKLVAVQHISNALGIIHPIERIIELAHRKNAYVFIDGAQASPHIPIDVRELDCDFYAFSSHKMFGPTGIGILYGKASILEKLPPYQGGGEMIKEVTLEKTTYNDLPYKFEAGTPNIAGAVGLEAAIKFITELGHKEIMKYEHDLLLYATKELMEIEGLKIIGNATSKVPVISFIVKDIHAYDIGVLLDKQGIAVRTGHHCCQPLMNRFQIEGTCRASFAFYNTMHEVDMLKSSLQQAINILRG
ncbi:MAG: cysteine desulfurase [Chitinophagales bacterium]|nr:cysteine desulfurase [Chitinophagales bacterium]